MVHNTKKIILPILLLLLSIILVRNAWVCDDAYITFRTISNFVDGLGLTWNVGERVQAYTHPLWMFLNSFFYFFTSEIYFTTLILSILLILATAYLITNKIAATFEMALVGILFLAVSKPFIDFSVSGLENPLTHLLLAILLYIFIKKEKAKKQIFYLFFTASLIALNRLDITLMISPLLIYAFLKSESKISALKYAFYGLLPLIAWELFSLFYYGFPFPNTAYAKLNTGIERADLIAQSLRYYQAGFMWSPLTLGLAIITPLLIIFKRQSKLIFASIGLILYLGYILLIGGDFMNGRFFTAPFVFAVVLLTQFNLKSKIVFYPLIILLLGYGIIFPNMPLLSGSSFGAGDEAKRWHYGISDERAAWYQSTGLLNQALDENIPNHQWIEDGIAASDSITFAYRAGIGFYGFFAGPKVHILDGHSLPNPLTARLPINDKKRWRIGHFYRIAPKGYVESLKTGNNLIENEALASYYDRLSVITKGELWSFNRLKEIIKFNLGEYDKLIDEYLFDLSLIRYENFSTPKVRGTKYSADGCQVFNDKDSLIIYFQESVYNTQLELSVDHNDDYELIFYNDKNKLGIVKIDQIWIPERGLRVDTLKIPKSISEQSYNYIFIKGVGGDQIYSVGHLRLLP